MRLCHLFIPAVLTLIAIYTYLPKAFDGLRRLICTTSGMAQGSHFGPLLIITFYNGVLANMNCKVFKGAIKRAIRLRYKKSQINQLLLQHKR